MHDHAFDVVFLDHLFNDREHLIHADIEINPGIALYHGLEKIILVQVLHRAAPRRGIGVGHQAGVVRSELLGQP
jgi:hypothetical protein